MKLLRSARQDCSEQISGVTVHSVQLNILDTLTQDMWCVGGIGAQQRQVCDLQVAGLISQRSKKNLDGEVND